MQNRRSRKTQYACSLDRRVAPYGYAHFWLYLTRQNVKSLLRFDFSRT
jgi:hypothetical protein